MRWISKAALAGLMTVFFAPAFVQAAPFDSKLVPADAKWVLHVDMDAARGTRTWDTIKEHLEHDANYQSKLAEVKTLTGMQFPQDLHDVTLFGASAQEEAGVVLIHAKIDKEKTMTALQLNSAYGSQPFGEYQVVTWDDKGKKMFGAFHDESTVIIGRSAENIQGALKTMDAKAPSIETGSALTAGGKPQLLLYVAAKGLPELKQNGQPRSPIIADLENAWISLSEKGEDALLQASVMSKTAEAAEQMRTALEGIKAMVTLSANSDNPDPNAKNAATALTTLKASTENRTMKIDWPISLDLVREIVDQGASQHKSATAPKSAAPGQ